MLRSSTAPLAQAYDLAMLDLDGVVYIGRDAVPGVPAHLRAARAGGMKVAFITNNASRTPEAVVEHLVELGVEAVAADVVTSAQAAARLVAEDVGAGGPVVCLGGRGLEVALREAGLEPVGVDADAAAIASGYGPQLRWSEIMQAAVRIRDGLPWTAANTDYTIPTAYGVAPGHGVLVETLARFSGVSPRVAGKPARPLLDETVRRVGGARPLMVGDRLDTDIEGAHNAGVDSLLVLTGVTGLPELVAAAPEQRPTYVAPDLGGLAEAHPVPDCVDGGWELPGWRATVRGGRLEVGSSPGQQGSAGDWWRVVACAAWAHRDATGAVPDVAGLAR